MNIIGFKNTIKLPALLFATIVLSACASQLPPMPIHNEYILTTGDHLKVNVYGDETLSGEFTVNTAGNISMPLIRGVHAAGLTTTALETAIEEQLHPKYMNDPKVSVEVLQYGDVFVLGEVRLPGKYPYTPNMTIMQSVAVAGGYTYRGDEGGADVSRLVNGQVKEYHAHQNDHVLPGDTIYIDRRWF